MRVLFPDFRNPRAGKGFQLQLLYNELPKLGVQTILKGPHDLCLENSRIRLASNRPRVLRVDGVYHDSGIDWKSKNQGIRDAVKAADHVVCQSEYGKFMVQKYTDLRDDNCSVVLNGGDPNMPVCPVTATAKHEFITVSKWRPHKRLWDTLDAFLLAGIPDSCIHVFGDFGKGMDKRRKSRYDDTRIRWHGPCFDRPVLMGYIQRAMAMVHLCMHDTCSNSVVESLCLGTPVICGNTGGTQELVEPSYGWVLPLAEKPYDGEPIDLYNPTPIDVGLVAAAMREAVERPRGTAFAHVHIHRTAQGYLKAFERVL